MNLASVKLSRLQKANDISDDIGLRLKFLEAVAWNFCELHGTKEPVDHQQAALWYRIGDDLSAAQRAISETIELMRGGEDEAT